MLKQTLALVTLLIPLSANAALHDRGNGLIYDDARDVTWMQDANYAATQYALTNGQFGDEDGRMTWDESISWVGQLNYGNYDNWRLSEMDFPHWLMANEFENLRGSLGNLRTGDFGNCSGSGDPCILNDSFIDPGTGFLSIS